jgi:ferrochelatase
MEVVYDLDTEALETARELQLPAVRSATPQGDGRFVTMVRELVLERAAAERGEAVERPSIGAIGPMWDVCPVGCCPNAKGERPALCGSDG